MPESRAHYSEDLRQMEHLAPVAFAFLLPYLSWIQAITLALCALAYGALISPHLLPATRRSDEKGRGFSSGKAAYALSVLGLLVVFPKDMYIVAAVWANLAVGDAASNLIGRRWGRKKLPWNIKKSWLGLASAFFFSTLAAAALIQWNGLPSGTRNPQTISWYYAIALALICSVAESLPLPVDDNISICLAGGAFMGFVSCAIWPGSWTWSRLGPGLLVSAAAALPAWFLRTVSPTGALWGISIGSIVYFTLGFRGFVLLGTFFVLGSLFSKIGYANKSLGGLAQANQGRRSGRHVWGKGFAALLAAVAAPFLDNHSLVMLAFVTALATSLCDTTATELGQLAGKRPVLLSNLKAVPRGTPGAASLEGSVFGLLAATAIAIEGYFFHFVGLWGVLWAVVAAASATHLEGFLVARHEGDRISGPLMNAFHTVVSMLIAVLLARIRL